MTEQELIGQLIQVACPGALVERDKWSVEPVYIVSHNETIIGTLSPEGPEWLVRQWITAGESGSTPGDGEGAYFNTLPEAIRRLFQLDGRPTR